MGMESMSSTGESGASTATTESSSAPLPVSSLVVEVSPEARGTEVVSSRPLSQRQQQPSSSRYKGVVPQPNGRWGAQIYERHARIWLGTFPDEASAARAYDVAALRFRGRHPATNFPAAATATAAELAFLAAHSKAEIVDMLRKHTYADELRQRLRSGGRHGAMERSPPTPPWEQEPLFEKSVTPSDVGKLNRLVVPKQHAEKHFPLKRAPESTSGKGVLLNFEDGDGKVWRFRYSYWNSSQSYVLTKGWSRFVREKGLKAGDTVAFSRSACGPEKQLYISCKKKIDASDTKTGEVRVVMLFGIDIAGGGQKSGGCSGGVKRGREMEQVFEQGQFLKRQCLAHQHALGALL